MREGSVDAVGPLAGVVDPEASRVCACAAGTAVGSTPSTRAAAPESAAIARTLWMWVSLGSP